MSLYELKHGYYLYLNDSKKIGCICENRDDIYKIVRDDIDGVNFINVTEAEYPVIDAILRNEDTVGIQKAIAEYRRYKPEYSDKTINEIINSLSDNAISNPLGRVRNRLADNFEDVNSVIAEEIIPKINKLKKYHIPAKRVNMPTMEAYEELHDLNGETDMLVLSLESDNIPMADGTDSLPVMDVNQSVDKQDLLRESGDDPQLGDIKDDGNRKSIKEILKGLLCGNTKKIVILFVAIIIGVFSICIMLNQRRNDIIAKKQAVWLRDLFISGSEGDGWGDSSGGRTSYSIEEINANKLGPGITFNSVSDGRIGNEKNFVAAKVAGNDGDRWEADVISVEDGQIYTLCLYVNNDNPNGTDAIANDVKTVFSLPTSVSEEHIVIGYIGASNSIISRYWDTVALVSDEPFYLEYVKNSAKLTNYKNGEVPVDDEIITSSGVSLGYNSMDGSIPGGYNYSSILTIDVIAHKSVTAKIAVKVRIKGTKEWKELINAKVGDEVEYQIEFGNLLSKTVQDIMIRDILPNNVVYVDDSTYLYNGNYPEGVLLRDNTITTSGINIGSYKTQSNAYVRFTGRIVDKSLAEGTNQLVNWASVTNWEDDEKYYLYKDDASVVVNK